MEQKEIYTTLITKYGESHQTDRFIEEIGEAITAYMKVRRSWQAYQNGNCFDDDEQHLLQQKHLECVQAFKKELADVSITLEQMMLIQPFEREKTDKLNKLKSLL